MKKILRLSLLAFLVGFFLVSRKDVFSFGPTERKIIVFKPEVAEVEKNQILSRFQTTVNKNLRLVNGFSVNLPSFQATEIAKDPRVLRVDPDVQVFALPQTLPQIDRQAIWNRRRVTPIPTATPTPVPSQTIPWGISQILAPDAWSISSGSGVKVAVVDTGVSRNHPDLKNNLDLTGCVNFISSRKTCEDDNGHGTHVAGIIAAENNNLGVVGVAPKAKISSLKVLDRNGSGYLSDIIEALDWAIQNNIQVINMSLGTGSDVTSFHDAIGRVNAAGIVQVAAAGNSGGAVIYPAAYPEVIAVSAIDKTNTIASWSSRGPEVDLAAPGVDIYSTYLSSTYKTLSGTSMASPHVAGAVALLLTQISKCDFDANGICSPAEVEQRLEATAQDLGDPGRDDLYGAGLVNARAAL